jgi:hypothetical protein
MSGSVGKRRGHSSTGELVSIRRGREAKALVLENLRVLFQQEAVERGCQAL